MILSFLLFLCAVLFQIYMFLCVYKFIILNNIVIVI